jgi:hypothetical protein
MKRVTSAFENHPEIRAHDIPSLKACQDFLQGSLHAFGIVRHAPFFNLVELRIYRPLASVIQYLTSCIYL